jgi:TetR/AcrR family transcriptional regulator, lmrAB and yxaGH operons repressor
MSRPSDARERLIRTAARLFRQRGYDGVGLTEILTEAGAPKGSFYHHFPDGKEQLGAAAVSHGGAQMASALEVCFAQAPDFATGLRAFADLLARNFEASGFRDGCPVTSIALDTAPQSSRIAEAVRAVLGQWRGLIAGHARRLDANDLTDADAELLLVLIEGAWIVARIRADIAPLRLAAEHFLESREAAQRRP